MNFDDNRADLKPNKGSRTGLQDNHADLRSFLTEGCRQLKINLKEDQAEDFLTYLGLLQKWGKKLNLTKILNGREIVIKHFLDALSAFQAIEIRADDRIMDVGSGAGIPGIPIKLIQPSTKLTLVEPLQKKAAFLRTVCGVLKQKDVDVIASPVEMLANSNDKYDHILVRALALPPERVEVLAGLLAPRGDILLFRGKKQPGPDVLPGGVRIQREINLTLPQSSDPRRLVVLGRSLTA